MANKETDLLNKLQERRGHLRDLEEKLNANSQLFADLSNEWRRVAAEVDQLHEALRWARFIDYCNTPCRVYRVH